MSPDLQSPSNGSDGARLTYAQLHDAANAQLWSRWIGIFDIDNLGTMNLLRVKLSSYWMVTGVVI